MICYRVVSDLHTEYWDGTPEEAKCNIDRLIPPLPSDADTILLLAGDTGSYQHRNLYAAVIDQLCHRFQHVYDIPGNHFWHGRHDFAACQPPVKRDNYTFGQIYVAADIVAATLWADFDGGNPIVEIACLQGMNDFRQIRGITPSRVKKRHREHVEFLRQSINPGCIVMTHFLPSWQSVPPDLKADMRSGYYASDLVDLILDTRPAVWVHGHTHTACDYMIGDTRVICNPAGYEGRAHDPLLVFQV